MVDAETKAGKCDFNYTLTIDEPPSLELREWLRSDVFIQLYCSMPSVKSIVNEEDGTVKDEVVMDSSGQPVAETQMLGVSYPPIFSNPLLIS